MKRAPVPSLYRTFVDIMAELLGTNAEHIHLFSVRDTTPPNDWEEHQDAVDVMLAAHAPLNGALPPDTVWYRPSKINGLMWQHKDMVGMTVKEFVIVSQKPTMYHSSGSHDTLTARVDITMVKTQILTYQLSYS